MKNNIFFLILCLGSLISACVDPVEFDASSNDDLLVIDGQVDLSQTGSTVRLSRTGDLRSSVAQPISGASLTLSDDLGRNISYIETTEPGVYQIPFGLFPIEVGRSYVLDVTTPNGQQYRSQPEVLPVSAEIQEVTYDFSNQSIQVYVETARPNADVPTFFKWNVEVVYQVSEVFCGGLDVVRTCYFNDLNYLQQVRTFDASQTAEGATIRQELVDKYVDFSFGEKQVFSVYQSTISEEAFRYFSDINTLSNNTGNFFDIQPAAVRGNLFNIEDETELVLGYFRAVTLDTMRLSVTRGDLPDNIAVTPFCGIPGIRPRPFPPSCCECLLIPNSTLEQPPYWIE